MEIERITPEEIKKLVEKANEIEMKYLLLLRVEGRTGGCGYLYTYNEEVEVIYGKAVMVTLESSRPEECLWREKILVIPFTIPTVVVKRYRDKNPQITNTDTFFILTSEGWKHLEVEIPK
jgi:hypothetical protein